MFAVAVFSAAEGLHGLALILLFWATWHGLMQTYGFMRIYDLKQGQGDRQSARLDFALCVVIFAAGVLFSDARVYGIADTLSKTGLPLPAPAWLAAARWTAGISAALVICGYLVHLVGRIRRGAALAWPRWRWDFRPAGCIGWAACWLRICWWGSPRSKFFTPCNTTPSSGRTTGVGRKGDALVRPLGAMFQQNRPASLALYVALIAAFSSIRLMGEVASNAWTQRILMGLLTTSTFMHFYFDGFIWKVSERKTQDDLAIAGRPPSTALPARWRLSHAAGCAAWQCSPRD